MKIAVIPNYDKGDAAACVPEVITVLQQYNCEVLVKNYAAENGRYLIEDEETLFDCDLFIAIGGDGTIIHTAKIAAGYDIPILGINAGNLGFTAGVECNEIDLLHNLFSGKPETEYRSMVTATVHAKAGTYSTTALNDIVITGELSKIIEYKLYVGDERSYDYRADGFIVATPTGSTAYSLSAGGPVIEPIMQCFVFTPLCPHSLFSRSLIFSEFSFLDVSVSNSIGKVWMTTDGEAPSEIFPGDKIRFEKSQTRAKFIKLDKKNFYDTLNRKMTEREYGGNR